MCCVHTPFLCEWVRWGRGEPTRYINIWVYELSLVWNQLLRNSATSDRVCVRSCTQTRTITFKGTEWESFTKKTTNKPAQKQHIQRKTHKTRFGWVHCAQSAPSIAIFLRLFFYHFHRSNANDTFAQLISPKSVFIAQITVVPNLPEDFLFIKKIFWNRANFFRKNTWDSYDFSIILFEN